MKENLVVLLLSSENPYIMHCLYISKKTRGEQKERIKAHLKLGVSDPNEFDELKPVPPS